MVRIKKKTTTTDHISIYLITNCIKKTSDIVRNNLIAIATFSGFEDSVPLLQQLYKNRMYSEELTVQFRIYMYKRHVRWFIRASIKDIDKWDDPDLLQRSKTRIASRVCNMSVLDKKELAAGYKGCLRY